MNIKFIKPFLALSLIVLFATSCDKDEAPPEITSPKEEAPYGMTVLGKQLENPYSIENMEKALEKIKGDPTLKSSSTELNEVSIEPTHLYVRFFPKNEDELNLLKQDTSLILYDIPLDYEIDEPGEYYHDPSLPDTAITYQYASVVVNYNFPNVEHSVLSELFIIDEDEDSITSQSLKSGSISTKTWEKLEDTALEITNNLETESSLKWGRSKWRPKGSIMVWDDDLNRFIGVTGVEVRARRWFTTRKGKVDANGNFSCNGRFRRDANYSLKWERYEFSVRSGAWGQAKYNGPKKRGNWDLRLNNTIRIFGRDVENTQKFYATIFRAAYHYYYQDIRGLKRPPRNSFWKPQMKISAKAQESSDKNGYYSKDSRFLGIRSPIYIYRNTVGGTYNYTSIYATVIHELAHASHWELRKNNWRSTSDKVIESWARGVQWELTRMVYPNYLGRERSTGDYTLVVADMIDNATSDNTNFGFGRFPWDTQDQVSGYTLKQIEDVLSYTSSWNNWRDNLISKYNNGTEGNLQALFRAYE